MYEQYFGLKEKPFSLNPDPDYLYLSKKHQDALTTLNYGLRSQAGITVVTGEVGSGKTTLIQHILNHMEKDLAVGLVSNVQGAYGELLNWVLNAFELEHEGKGRVTCYQDFYDYLVDEYSKNHRTVLIIDEAQNLGKQMLEELRLLSNINVGKHFVLQMILVGQPELLELLQSKELRQFSQRISVNYHLDALNLEETQSYINHRIKIAGGNKGVFTNSACAGIFYHTSGVPRLINSLCDMALTYCFEADKERVDIDTVIEVVKDKSVGGIAAIGKPQSREAEEIYRILRNSETSDASDKYTE